MQLYLDSFGAFLKVRNGQFAVRLKSDGEERLFAPREVSAIFLTRGTAASTDAFMLALADEIPIIFLDENTHQPLGQVWSGQFGSISTIRKNQAIWTRSRAGMSWISSILSQKIASQRQILQKLSEWSFAQNHPNGADFESQRVLSDLVLANLERDFGRWPATDAGQLFDYKTHFDSVAATFRGKEGTASRLYFRLIARLLPHEWQFADRSKRPALDPFNALLNYGYGMLYTQCQLALMRAGLDPALGVLHADGYNRPTFVFDFIEKWRTMVDEIVLFRLILSGKMRPSDLEFPSPEVGWRLGWAGKTAIIGAFLAFFEEKTLHTNGQQFRRTTLLDLEARDLAQVLKVDLF